MNKIGRNDICSCGSGKKYKKCCYLSPLKNPEVVAETFDFDKKIRYVVLDNLMENQIYRDGPKIAESFDLYFKEDLQETSSELSKAIALFCLDREKLKGSDWRITCFNIIANASNTITSAAAILRLGYRLQPGILIRNVLESLAVVAAIIEDLKYHDLYIAGKLDSPRAISIAKKMLPLIGVFYGMLSKHFAHIGDMHAEIDRLKPFKKGETPANLDLKFIRVAANMTYITAEVLCYDTTKQHRYWKKISEGVFKYCPSEAEVKWQQNFLRLKD